ncbi:hypothetical protein [Bifidobacterium asteroides]|nr:hypothetical protein [Bifidobacterium asteroides]
MAAVTIVVGLMILVFVILQRLVTLRKKGMKQSFPDDLNEG